MMPLTLAPRYRLDDECPWLEGIDPSRHYWIWINGDRNLSAAIPGLTANSLAELRASFGRFRALQPGETLDLVRAASCCTIHCIRENCFAIATTFEGASVWHLFDQETLESLLRTAHPDWQCAPADIELGRRRLMLAWGEPVAA